MKERHPQVNKIVWPIIINKQKTPCDQVKDILEIVPFSEYLFAPLEFLTQ